MSKETIINMMSKQSNQYSNLERYFLESEMNNSYLLDLETVNRIENSVEVLNRTGTYGNSEYKRSTSVRKDQDLALDKVLNNTQVPSISIIIPIRGQAHYLFECIDALSRQSIFSHNLNCDKDREKINCEIIIVQDGYGDEPSDDLFNGDNLDERIDNELAKFINKDVNFIFVKLSEGYGRCTPRNFGLELANNKLTIFLDCRIILDECAIGEVWRRFAQLPTQDFALLGFKENLTPDAHGRLRHLIRSGIRRPRVISGKNSDWKVRRKVEKDMTEEQLKAGIIKWNDMDFCKNDVINYMELSNWLRNWEFDKKVLNRYPGYFLSSAMLAVKTDRVKEAGRFNTQFQSSWGFEDSFLGAVLSARGTFIIPCPTFSAFLIDASLVGNDKERLDDKNRNREFADYSLKDPISDHEHKARLPKNFKPIIAKPEIKSPNYNSCLPDKQLAFTYDKSDTVEYEKILLSMMNYSIVNDDQQFKTLTVNPSFFVRHLWQQHMRQRQKKKNDLQSVDLFYLLRERYDLWEKLLSMGKLQILIDKEGFENVFYYHVINDKSKLLQFSLKDSINQLRHFLFFLKEFPRLEVRLSYPHTVSPFFTVNDAVLTYNHRMAKKTENDYISRPKGEYFEAGNPAAKVRIKSFDDSWALASSSQLYNRHGTIKFLEDLLERLQSAKKTTK